MLSKFLKARQLSDYLDRKSFSEHQWGAHIHFYKGKTSELSDYSIAIIGVKEDMGSVHNRGSADAPDEIRKEFYKQYYNGVQHKVIDMGDILPGADVEDTYFALASVMMELRKNNLFCIVLGGGHDLTYGQFLAYQERYEMINVVVADERIDMKKPGTRKIGSESFLMPLFMHQPNYLSNYTHLAYQSYYCGIHELESLESLNFDALRLGLLRNDLSETEPVLRMADMLSLDISCIRQSDGPGNGLPSPNGFSGDEIVQLFRYAGYSDRLSSLGIYELNPDKDDRNMTAKLMAQCLWYFIEGYENKKEEIPDAHNSDFVKFTVEFEDVDHQLVFWKSKRTDRWWMEMPDGEKESGRKNLLLPCSYSDYSKALRQELPDRWMKAYNKLF